MDSVTAAKFSHLDELIANLQMDYLNPNFADYPAWDDEREVVLVNLHASDKNESTR